MTSPRIRPGHPYFAGAPLLVAHRGGAKLAPENTVAAFRQAVDDWDADILEMDVRLTADGRVVVLHDETVDRTTDGTGSIRRMSWARARELDAGYRFRDLNGQRSLRGRGVRIPLFEEVLDAFPRTRINVESKAPEAARPLAEVIRSRAAEHRVLIAAEFEGTRREARGYPGPWGASRSHLVPFWALSRLPLLGRLYVPSADAFQIPQRSGQIRILTPALIRGAHDRNIPVHVWTVDDPDDMRRLLAWGVDGIQTDRPDLLADVLVEVAGRPAPPGRRSGKPGTDVPGTAAGSSGRIGSP